MNHFPPVDAERLGLRLRQAGFRPLPDVNDDGVLVGTILWRVRDGLVEYLALRTSGFALAMRAEAKFNFQHPQFHGPVIDHRSGHAVNALDWLLTTDEGNSSWTTPKPVR
jgi:hypothetical protein